MRYTFYILLQNRVETSRIRIWPELQLAVAVRRASQCSSSENEASVDLGEKSEPRILYRSFCDSRRLLRQLYLTPLIYFECEFDLSNDTR